MTPATILVVEDDPTVRETLAESLTMLGYHTLTADSAEAALGVLESGAPDLILTDVHMGAMSGIELTARVKRDPRFQLTPVVILTAVADLTARVAGLEAGADDFFAKPFELTELRTRVAALLHVKSLVDQLERAENVITTLGATIEAQARIMAVVDVHEALRTERPYKAALAHAAAVETLLRETDAGAWDPRVVTALVDVLGRAEHDRVNADGR